MLPSIMDLHIAILQLRKPEKSASWATISLKTNQQLKWSIIHYYQSKVQIDPQQQQYNNDITPTMVAIEINSDGSRFITS